MLHFESDYLEGAHPEILKRLAETNMEQTPGYGADPFCRSAEEKILAACGCPDGEVFFMEGGTQTNETVISACLRSYEGVIASPTAHIATHEAGAVEHGGHKVLVCTRQETDGPAPADDKISAEDIDRLCRLFGEDANHEHEVYPGMVYISHPTEYGALYKKEELRAIHEVCRRRHLFLYLDGARLGHALASPENDLTLKEITSLTDAFYIGGTKVGALFGEALVFPEKGRIPHFYTITKQHGAMMAKGRILGIQFDVLFTDGLYEKISRNAIRTAMKLKAGLAEKGYEFYRDSPTNQQMIVVTKEQAGRLKQKAGFGFMQTLDEERIVIRFCTSWATKEEAVDELLALL
jgi:threonine aldolase